MTITPNPVAASTVRPDSSAFGWVGRTVDGTLTLAQSLAGQITAFLGAFTLTIYAFQKLQEPLKGYPLWVRIVLPSIPIVLALAFGAIPQIVDRIQRKRLGEITGSLRRGYFQLAPREDEASFTRVDGVHEEVLFWLEQRTSQVLYLTGLSGCGKSSLLAAYVVPGLERKDSIVIPLRGYQDPVNALEQELLRPGVIWQKPASEAGGVLALIERAGRYVRPKRLLVILDQFEEFVILQQPEKQKQFEQLVADLGKLANSGVTLLFVFRTDYIGLIEKLALPLLNQNINWKEVPPFTESAARDFMQGSGLTVADELLRAVLREAAEIEQTKGFIRPVTINLCGLVLGRFATGLPHGFRPGGLIRGFLRESILLKEIRDVAPVLMPHLITGYVTKRPRSIAELAVETGSDPAIVRGCLRVLGRSDRAIARPLDADQQVWEISHDFLVPLLDSIVARWRVSFWRKLRSWLPWVAAGVIVLMAIAGDHWRRDPILDLEDLGWIVQKTSVGLNLRIDGTPPEQSLNALLRTSQPLFVTVEGENSLKCVSGWSVLRNLTSLSVERSTVSDLSPLRDLHNLTMLFVYDESVRDVSPLMNLHKLETLILLDTQVRDVSPLRELHDLTTLHLDSTRASDLSPLRELINLTTLDVSHSDVRDVSPLRELHNLTTLDLSYTPLSDVSPLRELHNLTTLNLHNTGVSDLSPLRDLHKLTTLDLSNTRVSDVSPLRDLHNLTTLDPSYTRVSDVSPLRELHNLTTLDLSYTRVSDVSPLRDLHKLTTLDLSNTRVSDVSKLKLLEDLNMNF